MCNRLCVATNIELDQELLSKAMLLGGAKTKKEAVNQALVEFVQKREQMKIIDLFGTVKSDEDYDYKKQREIR